LLAERRNSAANTCNGGRNVAANDLEGKLAAAIDANWQGQLAWLRTLVGFASVRGLEGPCQDWIAREFAARGWAVDRYMLSDVPLQQLPGYAPVMDTDYS
jgi:acetylornithine deacetylase